MTIVVRTRTLALHTIVRSPRTLAAFALTVSSACASAPPPPPPRPVPVVRAEPAAPRLSEPMRITHAGFKTPESVLYDPVADRYLVSNVDGGPRVEDHHGFISRLTPDGKVEALRFIDGDRPDSQLDAPKGLAIVGNVLYVADITRIRKFDRATGKPLGAIEVPGAEFLNDLCATSDGTLYASDSGLAEGYVSSNSDAVFSIRPNGSVSALIQSPSLAQPNGLACTEDALLVTSFGRPEVQTISRDGRVTARHALPKGALDGITLVGKRVFIASWEAHAIYEAERTPEDGMLGQASELIPDLDAPADLGLDTRRNTLLIPLFQEDALVLWPLTERVPPAPVDENPQAEAAAAADAPSAASIVPPPKPARRKKSGKK